MTAAEMAGEPIVREIMIQNLRGLHARASAKLVQCAERFDAEVTVSKDGQTVGGTSIMGLMMLSACKGSTVTLAAQGAEAAAAIAAIEALIGDRFGEGE